MQQLHNLHDGRRRHHHHPGEGGDEAKQIQGGID